MFITIIARTQMIIDYYQWNPSSPPCNLFGNTVNVPATINGTQSTVGHLTNIGQPQYSADRSIVLACSYNSGIYKGTQYQINYSFLAGYIYTIVVSAYNINQNGTGSNSSLVLNLNNGGNGTSNSCTGSGAIDPITSGNLKISNTINASNVPTNYSFNWSVLSSNYSFLTLGAVCPIGADNVQYVSIRKVTITATLAPPIFTISPNATSVVCGASTSRTFTVNNVNYSSGTLTYNWDLGTTPNGWLLGGIAAPQFTTTSSNNLTLVSSSTATTVKNVKVTPVLNGVNQSQLTSTVSVTPTVPSGGSYTISGNNQFCNSSNYTVSNLATGTYVSSWSATPSGIVTITNSSNTGTLTRVGNGQVTLRANVTDACGNTVQSNPLYILVGGPAKPTAVSFNFNGFYDETTPVPLARFKTYAVTVLFPTESDYSWALSNLNLLSGQGTQEISLNSSLPTNTPISISVAGVNVCGTGDPLVITGTIVSPSNGLRIAQPTIQFTQMGSIIRLKLEQPTSINEKREIRITDKTGRVVKQIFINNQAKDVVINIADLKSDFYYVQIFNGNQFVTKPVFKY